MDVLIFEIGHEDRVFHRKSKETEPEVKPENTDIEDIKRWIAEVATRKFKGLEESVQRNKDNTSYANRRCTDLSTDIRKLSVEKDEEKEARNQEIARLRKTIRELKDELDKKANRAKPAPAKPTRT